MKSSPINHYVIAAERGVSNKQRDRKRLCKRLGITTLGRGRADNSYESSSYMKKLQIRAYIAVFSAVARNCHGQEEALRRCS